MHILIVYLLIYPLKMLSYSLAFRNRGIRSLRPNHVGELRLRHQIGLHLVTDHGPLLEGISIANKIGFAPGSTDEAEPKSRYEQH